jgi:hypothetical protein
MIFGQIAYLLFIFSHIVLKVLLGVSLVILGIYIFFLEGRIYFIKMRVRKFFKSENREDLKDYSFTDLLADLNISNNEKKLKTLRILWYIITILSIVLIVTY